MALKRAKILIFNQVAYVPPRGFALWLANCILNGDTLFYSAIGCDIWLSNVAMTNAKTGLNTTLN